MRLSRLFCKLGTSDSAGFMEYLRVLGKALYDPAACTNIELPATMDTKYRTPISSSPLSAYPEKANDMIFTHLRWS